MRPQARPIEFQSYGNKEVVNYSAIANKAKQLSDNVRTVAFDQVNDSITFKSSLIHDKPPVSIKPSDNSINNVSSINCTDGSTITGITSDSSNTDPTKAISTAIMIDVNNRIEKLESKTQNQTATANETTFTGNVQADTFNGYHLGFNNRFYTLPAIPFVNSDLVMEVGRYIDFHYNASTGVDKTSRLYISKPGTLYYDHSFVVNGGDIKARNCISDKGNLNNIVDRTVALETKNTEQDTRLDALETKDIAFEERIGSIEAMDTAQNETISNINTKNNEQDTRLDTIEQNTLKVSYIDTNAALKVTSADENNDPRYVLKFNINITFNDSNYYPIFTSEKKTIVEFSFSYIYSTSGKAYAHTCYVYADSSNGLTSNITIESCSIQKGSIDIVVSDKRTSDLHTFGITWGLAYYPDALVPTVSCDEYFISKNLAYDNEERLSSTEAKDVEQDTRLTNIESKNTEQDTRLNTIESKNTEQDTRLDALESKDIAHEERMTNIEAMDTAQNETISNINTKNNEQDTRLDTLEIINTEQDGRIDTLDRKDLEQDTRLDTLETTTIPSINTKNTEQDARLNGFDDSLVGLNNRLNALEEKNKFQNVSENGTVFDGVLISDNLKSDNENRLSEVEKYFDKVYPIGSVWVTVSNTTPPIGTWKIQNNGYAAYLLTNSAGTNVAGPLVYMYIRTA